MGTRSDSQIRLSPAWICICAAVQRATLLADYPRIDARSRGMLSLVLMTPLWLVI